MAKNKDPQPVSFFGRRLRELRLAAGLSWYALGKRADVDPRHLMRLERGERSSPAFDLAQRLARALGVGLSDFEEPDPGGKSGQKIAQK